MEMRGNGPRPYAEPLLPHRRQGGVIEMRESSLVPGAIGQGAVWGIASALVLTAFAALILAMSRHGAAYLPLASQSVAWASVFLGGVFAGRAAGRGGLFHGALGGLGAFTLALVLGTLIFNVPIPPAMAGVRAAVALVVGAFGGIIGVAL